MVPCLRSCHNFQFHFHSRFMAAFVFPYIAMGKLFNSNVCCPCIVKGTVNEHSMLTTFASNCDVYMYVLYSRLHFIISQNMCGAGPFFCLLFGSLEKRKEKKMLWEVGMAVPRSTGTRIGQVGIWYKIASLASSPGHSQLLNVVQEKWESLETNIMWMMSRIEP